MAQDVKTLRIIYAYSGKESEVSLGDLTTALSDFLDHFGTQSFSGSSVYQIIENR